MMVHTKPDPRDLCLFVRFLYLNGGSPLYNACGIELLLAHPAAPGITPTTQYRGGFYITRDGIVKDCWKAILKFPTDTQAEITKIVGNKAQFEKDWVIIKMYDHIWKPPIEADNQ